ncbi:MAG TPA: universal stress protein [Ignavibacteriaceae bacterium]|nr:universal stress protein [Ignavibacteriaceae bacterium]
MVEYKNILVPTDFSTNSVQALEFGHMLAKQNNSTLHVLHIIEPVYNQNQILDDFNEKRYEQSRYLDAEEELRRFINKISSQGVDIIEVLTPGKPYEQILYYSRKNNVDLIVIASHGWTGLSHLITGNVANKVFRYSEIPTICVKSNTTLLKEVSSNRSTFAENWVG